MGSKAPQPTAEPRLLLYSALFAIIAVPALAQHQFADAQGKAIRRFCRADYEALCPGVPSSGRAALECLQNNAASVSFGCHRALLGDDGTSVRRGASVPTAGTVPAPGHMRERLTAFREACGQDYLRFCRAVQPGSGRAVACLTKNESLVSSGCRQALGAVRQR